MNIPPDLQGKALLRYYQEGDSPPLALNTSYDYREEMGVEVFFRTEEDWPEVERYALGICQGRVLDIGAGAGSHALWLQQQGLEVHALDTSPLSVEVMKKRGVAHALCGDIFHFDGQKFDTLLLMMNGIGLSGDLPGLEKLLLHLKGLLAEGGQLLFDSSDISYLYEGMPKPTGRYFGEISYQYEYEGETGDWFKWLYLDQKTMHQYAKATGWDAQILYQSDTYEYLARLVKEG